MTDGGTPAPESWRIVVFTNIPGGVIYSLVNEVVRPLGHRVVGVVTSPGPKRRRSLADSLRGHRAPSARGDQYAPRPLASVPRPGRHRVGPSQWGHRVGLQRPPPRA